MYTKTKIDRLREGVESLLAKSGYAFSDKDRALLEEILKELRDLPHQEEGVPPDDWPRYISLLMRLLKFFGTDDFPEAF